VVTGHGTRKLVNEIYEDFDVFEVLDKLSFDPEKFKDYVLQATSKAPAGTATNEDQKKSVPRDKIEAFIGGLMQQRKSLKIFISHSSKDKEFASRLANDLRAAGVEVWYDEDEIKAGDQIFTKIEQGLLTCDFLIIILSPEAVHSKMVRQELSSFWHEEARRERNVILPALYKDCPMPPLLTDRRYADFRENYESGLMELKKSLGIDKGHRD